MDKLKAIVRSRMWGHQFDIGESVVLTKTTGMLDYLGKNRAGNKYFLDKNEVEILSKRKANTMKAMKDACLNVAKQLAKANNTVTTLEIKNELRRDYPYYYWDQKTVSSFMNQFAGDGLFDYTDNGTYRTYSLTTTAQKATTAGPVSKTVSAKKVVKSTNKRNKNISRSDILFYAQNSKFESVVVNRSGKNVTYTLADIKRQKKSPLGYITRCFSNVVSINVNGRQYFVK